MTFAHKQKGMSALGWVFFLAVVAFLASTAFKVIPHYLDFYSLEKIIKSMETDNTLEGRTIADIYSHISRGAQVNSIHDLDLEKALQVSESNGEFQIRLTYEKREPLIGNIDLMVRFDKAFRVRAQ